MNSTTNQSNSPKFHFKQFSFAFGYSKAELIEMFTVLFLLFKFFYPSTVVLVQSAWSRYNVERRSGTATLASALGSRLVYK